MKNIILILLACIGIGVYGQTDYYAKDLPEYTTISNDSTDVLYIDDSGIDKHLEMPTLISYIAANGAGGDGDSTWTEITVSDTIHTNTIEVEDTIFYRLFGDATEVFWLVGRPGGSIDSGTLSAAWYGLRKDLKNPNHYLNDQKEIDGKMEMKVWYIDDDTKEPRYQYGIKGLSPLELGTATQINHEILTRYVAMLYRRQLILIGVFIASILMVCIIRKT